MAGFTLSIAVTKDVQRFFVRKLLLDEIKGIVNHSRCNALLAIVHQTVDELGQQQRVVTGVGLELFGTCREFPDHDLK